MGCTGQRRPSRSPRSQRSRSADVDCLRKYTERRVEERRHTETSDIGKLDPSRWIPLPRNMTRGQSGSKKPQQATLKDDDKRRYSSNDAAANPRGESPRSPQTSSKKVSLRGDEEIARQGKDENRPSESYRKPTGRSYSTDVTVFKKEKCVEARRHTECTVDTRMISTRWIPQINAPKFRYETSPFAKLTNTCEITRNAATRWMTFAKNPSPCSTPRMSPGRKSLARETPRHDEEALPSKENKMEVPRWQPVRKFVTPEQSQDECKSDQDQDDDYGVSDPTYSPSHGNRFNRLSQRMRDLYDFKTENEWPKRVHNPNSAARWISKSSSEEENHRQRVRRNSQDLEFNDRMEEFKYGERRRSEEARSRCNRQSDFHRRAEKDESKSGGCDVFEEEREERMRKFNERLRYSEDLGRERIRVVPNRRTYSDDYEEKRRRESRSNQQNADWFERIHRENKRNSDASTKSRESRGSYAEIESFKRNSRASEVSYASVVDHQQHGAKRGSLGCERIKRNLDVPPRRAFSQGEERPSTPVPPIEMNSDRRLPLKTVLTERQKRDSTRYKVYLT